MNINELIEKASKNRVRAVGIIAVDKKWGIGIDDKLPKFPYLDLQWFKHNTKNKICIVGSKTFATLPSLPDRKFIVLTRDVDNWTKTRNVGPNVDNRRIVGVCKDIEYAINRAKEQAFADGQTEVMVIGGADIYNYCIENRLLDNVLVTHVNIDAGCNININNQALSINYSARPMGSTNIDGTNMALFNYKLI